MALSRTPTIAIRSGSNMKIRQATHAFAAIFPAPTFLVGRQTLVAERRARPRFKKKHHLVNAVADCTEDGRMKRCQAILISALFAMILGGCGGGGGGGVPSALELIDTPATGTINTGSVLTVAGRSVDAALQSGGLGDITDFVGLTVAGTNNASKLGVAKVLKPAGRNVWSQIPVGPETTPCIEDGTVTVSGDIASPLTVTAGDFLDYVWATCDDGLGQVINGQIGMTFTDFEGDLLAGRILLGVSLIVANFRVTEDSQLTRTDGDLTLTIDSRTQPNTIITSTGSSLDIGNNISNESLSNFSSIITENTAVFPSNFTTDVTGTVSSTRFNGSVNYDTPVPFQSTGNGFPYTGEFLIVGANNARIRIIAISATSVRITADFNGDGAVDSTTDTTWEALING